MEKARIARALADLLRWFRQCGRHPTKDGSGDRERRDYSVDAGNEEFIRRRKNDSVGGES